MRVQPRPDSSHARGAAAHERVEDRLTWGCDRRVDFLPESNRFCERVVEGLRCVSDGDGEDRGHLDSSEG